MITVAIYHFLLVRVPKDPKKTKRIREAVQLTRLYSKYNGKSVLSAQMTANGASATTARDRARRKKTAMAFIVSIRFFRFGVMGSEKAKGGRGS
jgi:hypothetical protein